MIASRRLFQTQPAAAFKQQLRSLCHAAYENLRPISSENLVWRANQDDPRLHTSTHEGLYYILPKEQDCRPIFNYSSPFDIETTRFYRTIGMVPLMIRRPSLDAMSYIKSIKPDMPNLKILFYGDKGHGKTHTLTHLIHYLHMHQEYFIIHIREMKRYARSPLSMEESTSRPGRIDTNTSALRQLRQFKAQNTNLLEKYKDVLKCSQDYTWSLREKTEAGEPLTNVIDHGTNRSLHASDCLAVLFKELTLAADAGQIKLASVLDNVRFLFLREAGVLIHKDRKKLLIDEMTVARAIRKLIKTNYKNGLVLATCDDKLSSKQNQTPQEVIGQEGWDFFDPFIPLNVPKYSRKEFESCMNLYQDIGWLTRPESSTQEARDEIRFISGLNPGQVHYLCQSL